MAGLTVTIELLQHLAEELRNTVSTCTFKRVRSLCQAQGVRVRSKKFQAYRTKADFARLLVDELLGNTVSENRGPPSSRSPSTHARPITPISSTTTEPFLDIMIPLQQLEEQLQRGNASGTSTDQLRARTLQELGIAVKPDDGRTSKRIMERTLLMVSIEKAGKSLKELFHPDSDGAAIVRDELASRLKRLRRMQQGDDDEENNE